MCVRTYVRVFRIIFYEKFGVYQKNVRQTSIRNRVAEITLCIMAFWPLNGRICPIKKKKGKKIVIPASDGAGPGYLPVPPSVPVFDAKMKNAQKRKGEERQAERRKKERKRTGEGKKSRARNH